MSPGLSKSRDIGGSFRADPSRAASLCHSNASGGLGGDLNVEGVLGWAGIADAEDWVAEEVVHEAADG